MAQHVCNGATLQCSFGVAPSSLVVLPVRRVNTSSQPAATIMDFQPMVNIPTFGMCMSPANPTVAAATAAALGVLATGFGETARDGLLALESTGAAGEGPRSQQEGEIH